MGFPAGAVVADAMVTAPKVCAADSTVSALRDLFADDHVHAALVVDSGALIAVVERGDLDASLDAHDAAARAGRLDGRVVSPHAPLQPTHRLMLATHRRRLAVVAADGTLLGLLCLKQHGDGFCTDAAVRARADERITAAAPVPVRKAASAP